MNYRILGLIVVLVILASTAFAYSGFNRYYYTNYSPPTVYYSSPPNTFYGYYGPGYVYSSTYYRSQPVYVVLSYYVQPAVVYPSYYPNSYRNYSNISIYGSDDGWGISIGRGSVCGYYGYC